jgi:outer membrane protein assembly factor BamD
LRRIVLASALLAVSCLSGGHQADIATLASNSDQIIWEAGQKAYQKKQWEPARQHFKRIIDGFPQSEYGPGARLALGDSYYSEGGTANYILAISDYRDFLTLFPSHPRADYAQFLLAECHFRQRNGPDRDPTNTEKALVEYQRLLEQYPSSSYIEEARKHLVDCRQSLARSEFMAGYFYQRTRQAWRAAISRYEAVLSDYPDFARLDEVLFRISECLVATGRGAEALPHLGRLRDTYPGSSFAAAGAKLQSQIPVAPPPAVAPTPSPTPSPELQVSLEALQKKP